jgi:hypothetical protein
MKTPFFFRLGAAALVMLFARNSFAQEVTRIDTLPVLVITAKSLVPREVTTAFKKDFQDAVNPKWFKMEKNYLIKFITRDQNNHALYHKNGYLYYHIAYGKENSLPESTKAQIKKEYPNGEIISAIRVNQDRRSIWLVNLKVGKLLILTREEDGELREVQRLKNAGAEID